MYSINGNRIEYTEKLYSATCMHERSSLHASSFFCSVMSPENEADNDEFEIGNVQSVKNSDAFASRDCVKAIPCADQTF